MQGINLSGKRIQIDKANARMVVITSAAALISVFCLVAAKSLWAQSSYQGKVIGLKRKANTTLSDNVKAVNQLEAQYTVFASADTNLLGGSLTGSGPLDGANPKITLDALPSKYDFPAVTSSIEKLLLAHQFKITAMGGTDDEVNQDETKTTNDPKPQPIEFTFTAKSSYSNVQAVISDFEHSIRPINIEKMSIRGTDSDMELNVTALTYYQPAKSLQITSKVVN